MRGLPATTRMTGNQTRQWMGQQLAASDYQGRRTTTRGLAATTRMKGKQTQQWMGQQLAASNYQDAQMCRANTTTQQSTNKCGQPGGKETWECDLLGREGGCRRKVEGGGRRRRRRWRGDVYVSNSLTSLITNHNWLTYIDLKSLLQILHQYKIYIDLPH